MNVNTTKPVANTPWRVVTANDYSGIAIEDSQGALVLEMEWDDTEPFESDIHDDTKANAELIVRAVNSHAALVEALEGCLESMAKVRQDPFTTCACAEQLALAHRHATIALALAKEQS